MLRQFVDDWRQEALDKEAQWAEKARLASEQSHSLATSVSSRTAAEIQSEMLTCDGTTVISADEFSAEGRGQTTKDAQAERRQTAKEGGDLRKARKGRSQFRVLDALSASGL